MSSSSKFIQTSWPIAEAKNSSLINDWKSTIIIGNNPSKVKLGEQVKFVPNAVGWGAAPGKFCSFYPHLN